MNKIFVFDTNVLLSAAMNTRSASHTAFLIALRKGYIVYSEPTLAELKEKIYLTKFDKYAPLSRREDFYYKFEAAAYPTIIKHTISACRDPKDDKFLELAKSADANCIITKDNDLLVLHPFDGISIFNVTHFLNWI
jgi:uncharacterized protein